MLNLQNNLKDNFYKLTSENEWSVEFNQKSIEKGGSYIISFKRKHNWQDISICIQFESGNFNGLFFGLNCKNLLGKSDSDKLKYENYLFRELDKNKDLSLETERYNGEWTYWKHFDGYLRNWNSETLAKIPSGQLADEIWQEIEPLCKAVTQLNYPNL